jgi:hypothetical protein
MVQMLLYYKADLTQVNVFDEAPVTFATGTYQECLDSHIVEYSVKRLLSALDGGTPAQVSSPMTKLPPISLLQDSMDDKKFRSDPNNNNFTTSPQTLRRNDTYNPTVETTSMVMQSPISNGPVPVPLNWYHYNTTPSQSDLSIILANKVIGDLNSLIQV